MCQLPQPFFLQNPNILGFQGRPGLLRDAGLVMGSRGRRRKGSVGLATCMGLFAVPAHFTSRKDSFVFKGTHLTGPRLQIRKAPHAAAQPRRGRIIAAPRTAKAVTETVVANGSMAVIVVVANAVEAVNAAVAALQVHATTRHGVLVAVGNIIDVNPFQIVDQVVNAQREGRLDTVQGILASNAAFGGATAGNGSNGGDGGVVRQTLSTRRASGGSSSGGGSGRLRCHGVGEIVFLLVLHLDIGDSMNV